MTYKVQWYSGWFFGWCTLPDCDAIPDRDVAFAKEAKWRKIMQIEYGKCENTRVVPSNQE